MDTVVIDFGQTLDKNLSKGMAVKESSTSLKCDKADKMCKLELQNDTETTIASEFCEP